MILRIKNVKHVSDYKLELLFNDDKTKIVDFINWINDGGVYMLPLKDVKYFKKVKMDKFNYSICWPNGADFSPDILYEIGEEMHGQERSNSLTKLKTDRKLHYKKSAHKLSKKPSKKAKI